MVYISRLRLKNFKSFKIADLALPKTFVCFAGPNGSGKSNLCDSIRFVLGETSLRSMRAKKVSDLIHADAKSAEVTLIFENNEGKKEEVKRAIREDGKILYKLNGEKTTRSSIVETLKKYNLDGSGRNTIAQGEVQRIINMNGRERRGIIDTVAGISDFEEKKKEAISELQTVESRIKEANLVLGERQAFVEELGREKETAINYLEIKKKLNNARGSLINGEIKRINNEIEGFSQNENKLDLVKNQLDEKYSNIEKRIAETDSKRNEISSQLQSKQNTSTLIKNVEGLKALVSTKQQIIADRENLFLQNEKELEILNKKTLENKKAIEEINSEKNKILIELEEIENKLEKIPKNSDSLELEELEKQRNLLMQKIADISEEIVALDNQIKSSDELIKAKNDELDRLPKDQIVEINDETEELENAIKNLSKELEGQFLRTKKINIEISEIDKRLLDVREKASIYKVRSSPQLSNPALAFISELKTKEQGIYGTVADLINFDPEHASAVEAAAGSRLFYIVVDSLSIASSIIEKLKKARCGRATFIPIDTIKASMAIKSSGYQSILNVIEFDSKVSQAMHYVFADTLLVPDISEARRVGVGTARMVTMDGEIFERSGIVSGGKSESGALGSSLIRKIEQEIADLKNSKDSLMAELYSIRENESRIRTEKSSLELQKKTIELQKNITKEKQQDASIRSKTLNFEITSIKEETTKKAKRKSELEIELQNCENQKKKLFEKISELGKKIKETEQKTNSLLSDLSSKRSELKTRREGYDRELSIITKDLNDQENRLKNIKNNQKENTNTIKEANEILNKSEADLEKTEKTIMEIGKELEGLFLNLRSFEKEFSELGKELGQIRIEKEKITKELNSLAIKKVASSTRLEDLLAESKNHLDFELIEFSKEELSKIILELETKLNQIGSVNIAAIELFEKKKAEVDEISGKILKLDSERESILLMISEIEERKKEAFNETYSVVSNNFTNMFKHINIGEGHLHLDKPQTPFESGLFIKIRRNNRDYSLDALSGGEKTLVALMFIFALQFFKPAPFYILDEVDAALDKPNSTNLSELVAKMASDSQFIVVSHNDIVMSNADSVIGVAKTQGTSRLVGIKLK